MDFRLDREVYTLRNALLWGNCLGHAREAQYGILGKRVLHGMIAILELFPIVSQIISLAEYALIRASFWDQRIALNNKVLEDCVKTEKNIRELKAKLRKLKEFIKSKPDLKSLSLN